jgi:cysteine-rich repeat protein
MTQSKIRSRLDLFTVLLAAVALLGVACNGGAGQPLITGPICGDGGISVGSTETCDPPGTAAGPSGNTCRADCTFCGDGVLDAVEQCDDANDVSGDGCENDCTTGACMVFVPDAVPGTVSSVGIPGGACNLVTVELQVADVNDLFAAELTVQFAPAIVAYDGLNTVGSILESGGTQVEVIETALPGSVQIGVTRLASTGVDAVGSQRLLRLTFRSVAGAGMSAVGYTGTDLFTWTGGTLEIQ